MAHDIDDDTYFGGGLPDNYKYDGDEEPIEYDDEDESMEYVKMPDYMGDQEMLY